MLDCGGTVVSRVVQMKKTEVIIFHRLSVLPASAAEHSICSAEFVAQVVVSALTCCSQRPEAYYAQYVCRRSDLGAVSMAGRIDITPIRCKACEELTGMQCDLPGSDLRASASSLGSIVAITISGARVMSSWSISITSESQTLSP